MSALSGIVDRLREGRFVEALEAAKAAVRSNPMDLSVRRTLFELLAAAGDWSRCRIQAEALGSLGDGDCDWIGTLGVLNACEARDRFWAGSGFAQVVGSLDEEDHALMDAARAASRAQGAEHFESLRKLRGMASGLAFGPGTADGVPFEELATLDDRLPGCLEVAFDGEYHWLWLGSVASLEFAVRPGNLTDLRWIPAKVVMEDGSRYELTVFGCYPGTETCEQEDARIGKVLHWLDAPDDLAIGAGPQALAIDGIARPLHGLRLVEFHGGAAETPVPGSGDKDGGA